jgi:hypothetical protein
VAYCGGIDLCPDRWDTNRHDSDPRRTPENYAGWHDMQLRLRGPAVLDIETNFRDRWNARRELPSLVPYEPLPPVISDPLPPVAASPGTHHVQVLRTFACIHSHYQDFAPSGELTCLAAYLKAIGRAQNYIYLEDQYLVSAELAAALDRALDTVKQLVILVPEAADAPPVEAFNFHQAAFLRTVTARHPGKVHVFHPLQPSTGRSIYVHSKVMVIDDVYAVVGSPNVNRRSTTHDTELAAAVVDADVVDGVCRYARDLRLRLWGEHLALSVSDPAIADPIAGVAEWERQASAGTFRVRRHVTPMPQGEWQSLWDSVLDPDGRCSTRVAGAAGPAVTPSRTEVEALSSSSALALVDLANQIASNSESGESMPMLSEWVTRQGAAPALAGHRVGRTWTPAEVYDAVVHHPAGPIAKRVGQYFEVIAQPREVLRQPLQPGDLMLCRGPGDYAHAGIVSSADLHSADAVRAWGGKPEAGEAGSYAEFIEAGRPSQSRGVPRRVATPSGRVPEDTVVLRRQGWGERLDPLSLMLGLGLASSASRPPPPQPVSVTVTGATGTPPVTDPDPSADS